MVWVSALDVFDQTNYYVIKIFEPALGARILLRYLGQLTALEQSIFLDVYGSTDVLQPLTKAKKTKQHVFRLLIE